VQNCCCSSINDFANGTTVAEWSIRRCDIYNLYRYNWAADAQTSSDEEGFLDQNPSSVQGFVPFVAAYFFPFH